MGNAGLKQHYETASKTGVLQVSNQKLKEIPDDVFGLAEVLRNLDISKNRIAVLPDEISRFKQIKQLNIEGNRLQCLPSSISSLKKLEMLNASLNMIRGLPSSFVELSHLKQIYLSSNRLREFPIQLLGIKTLEVVELSNNKIGAIPTGMNEFYATELILCQNEISTIGDDLHKAPRLKILRLDENCLNIDAITPALLRDSKLHAFSVEGNLFEMKKLALLEGYNEYIERYTAMKKKMF